MSVIIRTAALEDEHGVIELWRSCGLVVSYNDPRSDFRFAVEGVNSAVLVAEDPGGTVIGSVMVGHDGHRGWLYYVSSTPERRGRGIGRRVVDAAERWLLDRGVSKAQLMIRGTNEGVVPFYARLGYDDTPRIVMSKQLVGGN